MKNINPELVAKARKALEEQKDTRRKIKKENILSKIKEIQLRKEVEEMEDFDVY